MSEGFRKVSGTCLPVNDDDWECRRAFDRQTGPDSGSTVVGLVRNGEWRDENHCTGHEEYGEGDKETLHMTSTEPGWWYRNEKRKILIR